MRPPTKKGWPKSALHGPSENSQNDRLRTRRPPGIVFHLAATNAETLHRSLIDRSLDFAIIKRIGPFADQQFKRHELGSFYSQHL